MQPEKLADSHCHLNILNLDNYGGDLNNLLTKTRGVGVGYFLAAAVNSFEDYDCLHEIAKKNSDVRFSVGLHPTDASGTTFDEKPLRKMAENPLVVAIGETGLDYYRCQQDLQEQARQRQIFREHIKLAQAVKKPLIVHLRDAASDLLQILKEEGAETVGGVFHCFTSNQETANEALKLNFYLGVSGIITFKNADSLRAIIAAAPIDKILLETDSPFLAPEPKRGKPNEPANLVYIVQKVAEIKGIDFATVAKRTTQNFLRLFNHISS